MSKTVKTNKSKSKTSGFTDSNSVLFTMGYVDLIFKLNLTDKDLEKPDVKENENEEKYYKIEDINSIKDLKFIEDKKSIWDKINVSGANDTIKQLLIGNKIAKKKCHIDYIAYGRPKFEGDEEFFDEIFNYATTKNHLIINKTPLDEGARSSLTIILNHKEESKTISIGKSQEEEDKENKKKKKSKKKEKKDEKKDKKKNDKKKKKEKEEEKKEEEEEEESEDDDYDEDDEGEEKKEEDYEETEAMKEKKIPKFKRANSVLVKLNPAYTKYDMIYINYVDLKNIPGDFKLRDLLELLKFFKSKGSTLFVNFYKPKKMKKKEEEEPEEGHEDDNAVKKEGDTKVGEGEKEEKEEPEEKKSKKKKEGPSRKMIELNQLYDFINIFFFDTKQCKKIFNKHYETFTEDNKNNRKQITRSKIFDYFIKGIATATKEEVNGIKTGLFLDELNKFTIIYASKKAANKYELDCQPHPKVNHCNIDLIKEYKRILKTYKNDYYSILIASLVMNCAMAAPNCQSTDVMYPAFLIALEIIKKKLEIEKNDLIPDDSIYKVKISEKTLVKDLQRFASGGKEEGFILDCTNKEKSTMKDYVSLYDYHLKTFFSSEYVRKDLKSKGFINTKGFIMYDPIYRNVMGKKIDKKKKKVTDEEMKNKLMSSIHEINVPSNIKDKEIDAKKAAKTQNLATESKLPFNKESNPNVTAKNKKHRKHRHKKGKREESSGESSDENSSGNNSGTESGNDESSGTVEKSES